MITTAITPPTLGSRIKATRLAWKWPQEQMAHALQVDQASISFWERDRIIPSGSAMVALSALSKTENQPMPRPIWNDGDQVTQADFDSMREDREKLSARVKELEEEIVRLKDCAIEQEKGIGAKTMRVEILPRGARFAVCITFPSGMEDGEKRAAETAIHTIALVNETAKAFTQAVNG